MSLGDKLLLHTDERIPETEVLPWTGRTIDGITPQRRSLTALTRQAPLQGRSVGESRSPAPEDAYEEVFLKFMPIGEEQVPVIVG